MARKPSPEGKDGKETSQPHPAAAENVGIAEFRISGYPLPQFPAPPSCDDLRPFPEEIDLRKTPAAQGGMWHADGEFCKGIHIQAQGCHLHASEWKSLVITFCIPSGKKSAFAISFHQSTSTFVKELESVLEVLLKHGYLRIKYGAKAPSQVVKSFYETD